MNVSLFHGCVYILIYTLERNCRFKPLTIVGRATLITMKKKKKTQEDKKSEKKTHVKEITLDFIFTYVNVFAGFRRYNILLCVLLKYVCT